MNPPQPASTGLGHKRVSLEVAIPVPSRSSSRATSSAVDDTSYDGTNGYSTPATSVAVTPVASDAGRSRKRVSASTRARELRSSAMSLHAANGTKRAFSAISDSTPDNADKALALSLQAQEYQVSFPKRPKLSGTENLEIADSEGESSLSELESDADMDGMTEDDSEPWQPQQVSKRTRRSTDKNVIPNSEDGDSLLDDGSEDANLYITSSGDSTDSEAEIPLIEQRPPRRATTSGSRGQRRQPRTRIPTREFVERPATQSWMTYRVSALIQQFRSDIDIFYRRSKNARSLKSSIPLLSPCGTS